MLAIRLTRKAEPFVATIMLASPFLMGCAVPDRRMSEDEQSCRSMGHSPGTTIFSQCLADLNDRRCAVARLKGGERHVASEECTRRN